MGVGCLALAEDVLDQVGGHHVLCFLLLLCYFQGYLCHHHFLLLVDPFLHNFVQLCLLLGSLAQLPLDVKQILFAFSQH